MFDTNSQLIFLSINTKLKCNKMQYHNSPFFFFCFSGPHLQHMEVPRLGVNLELQLLAYATATAIQDLSHVFDLPQLTVTLDP